MKLILSLIVCLVLGAAEGCTRKPVGPTPEQLAHRQQVEAEAQQRRDEIEQDRRDRRQEITDQVEAGAATLAQYQQGDRAAAQECVAHMMRLSELAELYTRADMEPEATWCRDGHTALAFALAKSALDQGQLNAADMIYRHLIEFYSGFAYQGIRDRARLGLDDVRAAR